MKILLIEDEQTLCELIGLVLTEQGFKVAIFNSGEDALGYIKQGDFDIALIDMTLPGMNGLDIINRAKTMHPHKTYILMSGYEISEGNQKKCQEPQPHLFLTKPFHISDVNKIILENL